MLSEDLFGIYLSQPAKGLLKQAHLTMRQCTGQLGIKLKLFCVGELILLLQCTTYQLSCPCFCICFVCVRNCSDRFSKCQIFATANDATGYNGKASKQSLRFHYKCRIFFQVYGDTYLDANTSSLPGSSCMWYFDIGRCMRSLG